MQSGKQLALNNNIFCVTNPARMTDALVSMVADAGVDYSDILVFLPSRRAVRTVERALVAHAGRAVMLPRLVALGEGADIDTDDADAPDDILGADVISNMERLVVMARLLAADVNLGDMATALPVARDLLRVQDYLENEGVAAIDIDWATLVDEKYAAHFQGKAKMLGIISRAMDAYGAGRVTVAAARNANIRAWRRILDKYKLVIVCASTASVPATADLMLEIAKMPNGRIILPGKIDGNVADFELDTNPYNSEYKFLQRAGCNPCDVIKIDVGASAIDFMNHAFGNNVAPFGDAGAVRHCHLVTCSREAEEAAAVAEIAARSVAQKKSVLVITPDAAGGGRIAAALSARGLSADFSGGASGTMTELGRAILNLFDDWAARGDSATFDKKYMDADFNLFEMLVRLVDDEFYLFTPSFDIADVRYFPIWDAVHELSDCLRQAGAQISMRDARAMLADVIGGVTVRGAMNDAADIVVLGTIESRMQTADVVILAGLNDGMFPARGYENAWLPRATAEKIGLPSPDRKVSLQALDFMTLSCGADVYWLRAGAAGGVQMTESRFLSRVAVAGGAYDIDAGADILRSVRAADNPPMRRLDYSAPTPPADWSDVYVTELELLIHNPYAFYARHILRLYPMDDYWAAPDARVFGNLVHGVIEDASDFSPDTLVTEMDRRAREILGPDSVMFHFWHRRFTEIAPVVHDIFTIHRGGYAEIPGAVDIAGRKIRARADRVWDDMVMDIKTGAAPTKSQLLSGNMPQLPLEAYMMQSGGFRGVSHMRPMMMFLQLRNNDVRAIEYDTDTTQQMITAAVSKVTDLINMYSVGGAAYEYRETGDRKYKGYDDLARVDD